MTNEDLIARLEALASQIAEWREDDDQGAACIDLTCEAEDLAREAAKALREAVRAPVSSTAPAQDCDTDLIERLAQIACSYDGPLVPSTCREAARRIRALREASVSPASEGWQREIAALKERASHLEDAAFHYQTCRTCCEDGEESCPSGKRFAAYLRGEENALVD